MKQSVWYSPRMDEIYVVEKNKTWFSDDSFWKTKRKTPNNKLLLLKKREQVEKHLKEIGCDRIGKL